MVTERASCEGAGAAQANEATNRVRRTGTHQAQFGTACYILSRMRLIIVLLAWVVDRRRTPSPAEGLRQPSLPLHADGKPFFYLADTAWELFHRLNRKEAAEYLDTRAAQGFTVVQAVALAELDGITDPNAYGKLPLIDKTRRARRPPARRYYWDHVDYIVDQANARGLYIAMLPSWGRWVNNRRTDEAAHASERAELRRVPGQALRQERHHLDSRRRPHRRRLRGRPGAPWPAASRSASAGKEDYDAVLMGFHPRGGETSSTWFHDDAWLDFNMHQTGHGLAEHVKSWATIAKDYDAHAVKPVIDGEPLYEDHPLGFRSREFGYSFDAHVRQRAYWDLFSGACGHTYGNHAVWQMYAPGRKPVNGPLLYWNEAIHRPGAHEMRYVRALIESRPFLSRVPDQSLIANALEGADHICGDARRWLCIHLHAQGRKFTVRSRQDLRQRE